MGSYKSNFVTAGIIYSLVAVTFQAYAAGQVRDTKRTESRLANLRDEIQKRPKDADIWELGRIGGAQDIDLLKKVRGRLRKSPSNTQDHLAWEATQLALAKLGDPAAFAEIVAESKSPDPVISQAIFEKLKYLNNVNAFQELRRLLDDDRDRGWRGDQFFPPMSFYAMVTLGSMVPDPPMWRGQRLTKPPYPSPEFVELWKKWFDQHPAVLK